MDRLICCCLCKKPIMRVDRIAKVERTNRAQYYYGVCCVQRKEKDNE